MLLKKPLRSVARLWFWSASAESAQIKKAASGFCPDAAFFVQIPNLAYFHMGFHTASTDHFQSLPSKFLSLIQKDLGMRQNRPRVQFTAIATFFTRGSSFFVIAAVTSVVSVVRAVSAKDTDLAKGDWSPTRHRTSNQSPC